MIIKVDYSYGYTRDHFIKTGKHVTFTIIDVNVTELSETERKQLLDITQGNFTTREPIYKAERNIEDVHTLLDEFYPRFVEEEAEAERRKEQHLKDLARMMEEQEEIDAAYKRESENRLAWIAEHGSQVLKKLAEEGFGTRQRFDDEYWPWVAHELSEKTKLPWKIGSLETAVDKDNEQNTASQTIVRAYLICKELNGQDEDFKLTNFMYDTHEDVLVAKVETKHGERCMQTTCQTMETREGR